MARRRLRFDGLDWDAGNSVKCLKHDVSILEIEEALAGPVLVLADLSHSTAEARYKAIGRTEGGRDVFVAFTIREREGRVLVRPISARYMHRKEVDRHG